MHKYAPYLRLKDHHPQQQGLRRDINSIEGICPSKELKDHHPQQQGLRLPDFFLAISRAQRPSSTTTRIKTVTSIVVIS